MKVTGLVVVAIACMPSSSAFTGQTFGRVNKDTKLSSCKDSTPGWMGPAAAVAAGLTVASQVAGASVAVPSSPPPQVEIVHASTTQLRQSEYTSPSAVSASSIYLSASDDFLDFSMPSYGSSVKDNPSKAKADAPSFSNPFADFDFKAPSSKVDELEPSKPAEEDKKAEEAAAKKAEEADKAAAKKAQEAEKAAAKKAEEEAAAAKKAEKEARRQAELEKQRAAVERNKEKEEAAAPAPAPAVPELKLDIPEFKAPDVKLDIPEFKAPDVKLPEFSAPKFSAPKFDMPKVDMPKVDMPKVDMPKVDMPKVDMPKVDAPKVNLPSVPSFSVPQTSFEMPKVPSFSAPQSSYESVDGEEEVLEPQEVRDERAKEARSVYNEADADAKVVEKQAYQLRQIANEKKKLAKAAKDEACQTRFGGKFLCIRPFNSGY